MLMLITEYEDHTISHNRSIFNDKLIFKSLFKLFLFLKNKISL
jgi:hypothetical protein